MMITPDWSVKRAMGVAKSVLGKNNDNTTPPTENLLMRLAFHDCIPYVGGGGGCDGCLNLDENLKGNFGLQHSAAVLEKIYKEKDFLKQKSKKAPKLAESLYESGKSRADLWAFAAIVALDFFQQDTHRRCSDNLWENMCGEPDHCFAPFPEEGRRMFRTGRVDCHGPAKDPLGRISGDKKDKQGYVTFRPENHPNEHGNGRQTTEYYDTQFGLTKRESLALMGAHTVADLNSVISRNAYAWMRGSQRNLFNNKAGGEQVLSL